MTKISKIIVGLGNPGEKYENTRHNIGRMIINAIAQKYSAQWKAVKGIYWQAEISIKGSNIMLCKPDTFMNNSGEAVRKIAKEYNIVPQDIIIIVDEYNYPVGKIQYKRGGSNGGHNGTSSIMSELLTDDFCRLRCGIGNNFESGGMVDYVLQNFEDDEQEALKTMITNSTQALIYACIFNYTKASSNINSGAYLQKKSDKAEKRKIKTITVYAASSNKIPDIYRKSAEKLGTILAENHITLMYGGGSLGLMGAVADSALQGKGKVIGVIPEFLNDIELGHKNITYMHVVKDMNERKAKLISSCDAIVVLPGGVGTLEEVFETLTMKQLGQFTKPIIFLNVNNYFTPILDMLDKIINENFMSEIHRQMWTSVDTPEKILDAIANAEQWEKNAVEFAQVK